MSKKRAPLTTEQRSEYGRRAFRAIITRTIDPTGALARRDPAEFARQFEQAKQAHMAEMAAAHRASAAKKRAAVAEAKRTASQASKQSPPAPFLWTCCPACNAENDVTLPPGVPTALCVAHYLAGKPWYPLGAHEWSIRKPWLVDGSLQQAKTPRAS